MTVRKAETTRSGPHPDPLDDAVPIDEVTGAAIQPTDPLVETALDDDEGGADPVDPDNGRPYRNKDAGVRAPFADRTGEPDDDQGAV